MHRIYTGIGEAGLPFMRTNEDMILTISFFPTDNFHFRFMQIIILTYHLYKAVI